MTSRKIRPLTRRERELWAAVAGTAIPLPGRAVPVIPPQSPHETPAQPARSDEPVTVNAAVPAKAVVPVLSGLERRTSRALARGRKAPDAVLDLHGFTQAEAHAALIRFLHRSHGSGMGIVLVVTGKGGRGEGEGERGVLRRMVPHWLASPDLRAMVLGFDKAGRRQGGEGALYVRLRRRRPAG